MTYLINELWIFSKDGVPLVEILKNTKVNSGLLGGFFSIIESFSKDYSENGIKSITLGVDK
ncbi:MAG: hypothetical protein ACFFAH_00630 [Promethearchaeota archaeon]